MLMGCIAVGIVLGLCLFLAIYSSINNARDEQERNGNTHG